MALVISRIMNVKDVNPDFPFINTNMGGNMAKIILNTELNPWKFPPCYWIPGYRCFQKSCSFRIILVESIGRWLLNGAYI